MADPPEDRYRDRKPFAAATPPPLLHRTIPVTRELPEYRTASGRRDVVAGLTVAALAVPAGMAYAQLAGLTPITGLYALLLPTLVYALLGSSRQVVVGPEGSLSALVAASVLGLAVAGSAHASELAATLALLVAACFLAARALRLGWIADYLSRPVLVGYIHGVAIVLVVGQLGKLLGLELTARDPLGQLLQIAEELGHVSTATLAVSVGTLAVLLPLRFLAPRLPAALIAVVLGIVAANALDLAAHGVAVVGHIPSGLPGPHVPTPPLAEVVSLLPAALGLFLVAFADGILTARSYAGRHGQEIGVGQELAAMAGANAVAGLTRGLPVGASNSRTAVNDSMGARTQVAGIVSAAAVAFVLLFLTAPLADLPKAVLGAAIVSAAIGLVDLPAWRELKRTDHVELAIAGATVGGVVAAGVLQGIAFAVGLSIVDVVRRSARPHDAVLGWSPALGRYADVARNPDARVVPGVVVYRLDDRLFFANADYVKGRVREALRGAPTPARRLVFDAEGVSHVDAAGAAALGDLAEGLAAEGVDVLVARLKSPVRERLDGAGVTAKVGAANFHPTVHAAVAAATAED